MRLLLVVLGFAVFLNAQTVEVVADKFFADEKKMISEFIGNVVVTKGRDKIEAQKIVITFDENRQPLKYKASGDVKIDVVMEENIYFGSAQTITYSPIKDQYTLTGNAFLHEKVSNRKVHGDKIFIDQLTGRYEVHSDGESPVKFIFKVEEKTKK